MQAAESSETRWMSGERTVRAILEGDGQQQTDASTASSSKGTCPRLRPM